MTDILSSIVKQCLPQMSPSKRRVTLKSLKEIIDEEFFNLASAAALTDDIEACPYCGCPFFVKRGYDARDNQRYLCRGCSRTFTDRTKKVFAATKLDRATWMRFAECHVDFLSLRASAVKCGVGLKTAFFMRHRLLEAIAKSMPAFRAEAGIGMELDECYLKESFKGNHDLADCGIPRKTHRRTTACDPSEKICVLTGINDAGDIFFEIAGRGNLCHGTAEEMLSDKLAKGAIVSTDGAYAYKRALATLGVSKHHAYSSSKHSINRVNNLHSNIKYFIAHFHGVSTRRLWNYLAWFKWLWTFRVQRSVAQLEALIVKQVTQSTYETTWRGYKKTPYPFYDFWVKQAGWDQWAREALGKA